MISRIVLRKTEEDIQKETQIKIKASKRHTLKKFMQTTVTPSTPAPRPRNITKNVRNMDIDSRILVFTITDWPLIWPVWYWLELELIKANILIKVQNDYINK